MISLFKITTVHLFFTIILFHFFLLKKNKKMSNVTQMSSYSNYESESNILLTIFSKATVIILYSEMICCLFLNAFTIVNLLLNSTFRDSKPILINLAISDMLYSSCIPFYSSQFINDRINRSFLSCVLSFVLDVSSTIVSKHFMI
jgi:hypothetical protein